MNWKHYIESNTDILFITSTQYLRKNRKNSTILISSIVTERCIITHLQKSVKILLSSKKLNHMNALKYTFTCKPASEGKDVKTERAATVRLPAMLHTKWNHKHYYRYFCFLFKCPLIIGLCNSRPCTIFSNNDISKSEETTFLVKEELANSLQNNVKVIKHNNNVYI